MDSYKFKRGIFKTLAIAGLATLSYGAVNFELPSKEYQKLTDLREQNQKIEEVIKYDGFDDLSQSYKNKLENKISKLENSSEVKEYENKTEEGVWYLGAGLGLIAIGGVGLDSYKKGKFYRKT